MVLAQLSRLFGRRGASKTCAHKPQTQIMETPASDGPHEAGRDVDALVSNTKGAIKIAQSVLDRFPLPGLSAALSIGDQLLDRIDEMRGNVEERKLIMGRLKDLVEMLKTMCTDGESNMSSSAEPAEQVVMRSRLRSSPVDARVAQAISKLEDALRTSTDSTHTGWLTRLWYSKQDAQNLARIRTSINNAIGDLEMQGGIAVQQLLSQLLETIKQEANNRGDREVLEKLKRSHSASYTSRYIEEKAKLQPGTRERILNEVLAWAKEPDQTQRIQIIYGPAGCGKSAVARAVCGALAKDESLGASFFFRQHDVECSDPYLVFPTIAYQLTHSRPLLASRIVSSIKQHVTRHDQSQGITTQGQLLFLDIIESLDPQRPTVLVFDGIDECSRASEEAVQNLLRLICQAADNFAYVRILIATRPETYIMRALPGKSEGKAILRNLWIDAEGEIDDDIRLFIQSELTQRVSQGNFNLLEERPNAVETLTQLSASAEYYFQL